VAKLSHLPTWLATHAERAVSRALGGSCSVPLAAHAVWLGDGRMQLDVALGHAAQPEQPLLKARLSAEVATTEAAEALGERRPSGWWPRAVPPTSRRSRPEP
jgi:hydroxymethylbilane synthase